VRVYPPGRVLGDLAGWRERIGAFWFWEPNDAGVDQARALESYCFADTLGGDELIAHPDAPATSSCCRETTRS